MKRIAISLVFLFLLISCGSSGSDSNSGSLDSLKNTMCTKSDTCNILSYETCMQLANNNNNGSSSENNCTNPNLAKVPECENCIKNVNCDDFKEMVNSGNYQKCPACEEICPDTDDTNGDNATNEQDREMLKDALCKKSQQCQNEDYNECMQYITLPAPINCQEFNHDATIQCTNCINTLTCEELDNGDTNKCALACLGVCKK